ncbi:MAG: sugar phosphate isomerase/epimerase [Clostridia bacterium]|nr:sugar phosphate isomerase/epimerase [Clostridia bacterium]
MRLCGFADEADSFLSGQIKALRRNGMKLLEIRGVDEENISVVKTEKLKAIKKELDKAGISVWSIGSPIGKTDPCVDFDGHIEKFKHVCESAEILGAGRIRMFSFFTKDEKIALSSLERLLKITPSGIVLCHENEKGIFGDDYESCLKIHKEFPEIKAVFDPANFVQCGVDTKAAWDALSPYVNYMHIKDALASGEVVPAGSGIGNVKYLVEKYAKMGGEVLTLEPHLMEFCGLSELENGESMAKKPVFTDTNVAFDAGADALKAILDELNLKY